MGYRSDITAVFYCKHDQWPAMKLFIDENFPDNTADLIKDEDLHEFTGRHFRGYKFEVQGWKWYPNYPEVIAFNEFANRFMEVADEDTTRWAYEFVRIGEDTVDVEETYSDHADYILSVNRSIEINY